MVGLGYAVSDMPTILTKLSVYVEKKVNELAAPIGGPFLPGEGNAVIDVIQSVDTFLWKKWHLFDAVFWNSSAVSYLRALDSLLSMPSTYFYPNVMPWLIKSKEFIIMI